MADKKSIIGKVLLVGAVAAAGVTVYLKREQLRKIVDDLVSKAVFSENDDIFCMDSDEDEAEEIVIDGAEEPVENDIVLKSEDLVTGEELEKETGAEEE